MPCRPCALSRFANPLWPPRKLGVQPCLARRAAFRTRRANLSACRAASRISLASCSPTSDGGKISPWCVHGPPSVAIFSRDASLGGYPWQYSRFMHPRRGLGREKRPSLARYRRHAFKMSWLWQDMRAMHPKSPANRFSGMHSAQILPGRVPFRRTGPSNHTWGANLAKEPPLYGPLESRTACESCQGPHCTGLSNLAREPLLTA